MFPILQATTGLFKRREAQRLSWAEAQLILVPEEGKGPFPPGGCFSRLPLPPATGWAWASSEPRAQQQLGSAKRAFALARPPRRGCVAPASFQLKGKQPLSLAAALLSRSRGDKGTKARLICW